MAIANAGILATTTAAYTSSGNNAITTIIVCNTALYDPLNPTLGQTNLYMYAVPSGGFVNPGDTPSAITTIVNGLPIPAGETVSFDQEKMVLSSGDMIVVKSETGSPAGLVITVSTLPV